MNLADMRSLRELEAEAIHVIRESAGAFLRPILMFSIGKDSMVLLHLAAKAFAPGPIPFPLLHIDTTWKFKEMIAFRDRIAREYGVDLIVHINQDGLDQGINPIVSGASVHTNIMKTIALKQALDHHRIDVAIGGAPRNRRPVPGTGDQSGVIHRGERTDRKGDGGCGVHRSESGVAELPPATADRKAVLVLTPGRGGTGPASTSSRVLS